MVDDEPAVARVIAETLEFEGYEVDRANNGRDALEKIAARSYDAILSDLRMPELDGAGLYREIERQQPGLVQRLAFVTGTMESPEYASLFERARAPVLSKPFGVTDLHRLVQRLLQGHR